MGRPPAVLHGERRCEAFPPMCLHPSQPSPGTFSRRPTPGPHSTRPWSSPSRASSARTPSSTDSRSAGEAWVEAGGGLGWRWSWAEL